MATTLKFRRFTSSELSNITGETGEIIIDLDKDAVTVHDGSTAGGFRSATESFVLETVIPYTESDTQPSNPKAGEEWYDTTNAVLYKYMTDKWIKIVEQLYVLTETGENLATESGDLIEYQ